MNQEPKQNYTFALIVVFIVCFLIGFITTMNNSMIAFCSEAFHLTAQQGQYVNTAFYGAYLLSIPFAFLMSKIGYKNTLILGLAVSGVGFVINSIGINSAIAAGANVYAIFLASMCLVAMGVVMLQNVANPYVMVLGSPEKGAFRMTLSQALNSVATTVAPLFITYVIINGKAPAPEYVPGPFLGLGIFTVIICLILVFLKLPRIDEGAQAEAAASTASIRTACSSIPTCGSERSAYSCTWALRLAFRQCCLTVSRLCILKWTLPPLRLLPHSISPSIGAA